MKLGLGLGFGSDIANIFIPVLFQDNWQPAFAVKANGATTYNPEDDKPTTTTTKWVDPINGSNGNTGDSRAQAYADIATAESNSADHIMLTSGFYYDGHGTFNDTLGYNPSSDAVLEAVDGAGSVIMFRGRRGDYYSWTLESGNVYRTSRSVVSTVIDTTYTHSGEYQMDGVTEVPVKATEITFDTDLATTIAAVQATPHSFYLHTDNMLYVHTHDGRTPDDTNIYISLDVDQIDVQNDVTVYMEGIEFWGSRPLRFLQMSANTSKCIAVSCAFRYSNTSGADVNDANEFYFVDCAATDNINDGFAVVAKGGHVARSTGLIQNCTDKRNGVGTSDNNNNGISISGDVSVVLAGGEHTSNKGPNVINTDGSDLLVVSATGRDSVAASGIENANFRVGGAFNGNNSRQFSLNCTSSGSDYDRGVAANGEFHDMGGFSGDATDSGTIFTNHVNILYVGQSLQNGQVTAYSGAGIAAFDAEAANHNFSAKHINGAKDAAAVHYDAAGVAGAYLNSTNDGEGEVFGDNLVAAVEASTVGWSDIDVVLYLIGNTDQSAIEASTITEADHKAAMKTLIDLVRARATNAIHILQPNIGNNASTDWVSWTALKRAQYELTQEYDYILESCGYYDVSRADSTHPDQAGHETIGERNSRMIAHYLGIGSPNNPLGAKISSAVFDPSTEFITVTVEHDDGTDFTGSDVDGHTFYQNGTPTNAGFFIRQDATSFNLQGGGITLDSGDTIELNWPYGTSKNISTTTQFLDNATNSLPLRPYFGVVATEA